MTFWAELDHVRARHDVLEHPFYVRWVEGGLSARELACYAGQYRHAVVALAAAADHAAERARADGEAALADELRRHALEEHDHVPLWDGFLDAVGGDRNAAALPGTTTCVRAWAGDRDRPLLASLTSMYVIEAAQPAISAAKAVGLRAHYGVPAGPGTAYFERHEAVDVEHAAAGRAAIEARLVPTDRGPLLGAARRALRGNWALLDAVEAA
jgi:pyrroloquinoline quinone (PQQ) biosynthesis protein C